MRLQKCFEFTGKEKFFQGHFPEFPLLPGVVQLKFAHEAAQESAGKSLILKEVKKLKFASVVTPKDKITLELEGESEITFRFLKGGEICSSGILVY